MSETMEVLKKRFLEWKSALESKRLNLNFEKIKMMVCGSEGEVEVIQSKIDPYEICGKRVTVNSVLCTKSDQCIHGRYFN